MISLKSIKWFAPLFMLLIPFSPFLNGIGCNFTFTSNNDLIYEKGTCKGGVLSVYIKHKDDNRVILKRMHWGYNGTYVYTYPIASNATNTKDLTSELGSNSLLFDDTYLLVGKISSIRSDPSLYATFFDHPIEILSISKVKGNMGFF